MFWVESRENLRRAVGVVSRNLLHVLIVSIVSLYLGIMRWGRQKV